MIKAPLLMTFEAVAARSSQPGWCTRVVVAAISRGTHRFSLNTPRA